MRLLAHIRDFGLKNRWLLALLLAAALLRLWQLQALPPGLTPAEADNGLAGLNLLHHGQLWSGAVTPLNGAYSWLSAGFLLLGQGLFWLRFPAALAGIIAVLGVYFWLFEMRNRRDALIGAAVMAALAWALGASREAGPASLVPAITAWSLWLVGRSESLKARLGLAVLAGLGFYITPNLWWLWILAPAYLVFSKQLHRNLVPFGLWVLLIAPGIMWAVLHPGQLGNYFSLTGSWHRLVQFSVHTFAAGGDWQLTVGSQPLFNAFYAIMAVLGLIVCLIRWRANILVLLPLAAGLLAGTLAPDGEGFVVAMVPLLGLIVAGIATMLEWWYATFPINAAARTSGRAAIGLILGLAAYQGYVQFFVAFANSSETYAVYREDAWLMGADAKAHPEAVIVTDSPARPVISLRTYPMQPRFATVKTLPAQAKPHFYIIGYTQRAAAETALAVIAPGGKLSAHTSAFDGRELYYTYELKP